LGVLLIAVVWQTAIIAFDIPPYILPDLSSIGRSTWKYWPQLWPALRMTLFEAGVGCVAGTIIAVTVAMLLVLVPVLERVVSPVVVAVNSVPVVAYAPISLVWLGMGPASKIAMVLLAAGFTVFVNAFAGLKTVDQNAVNLLRSFGASPFRVAWIFRLPAALPSIVTGIRVALVRSIIIAIVAEMLGAYEGLGRIIYEATQQIDFLRVWAAIVVASAASILLYGILAVADRRLVWWR
jgi:NitT/TauT family transport system permease protein